MFTKVINTKDEFPYRGEPRQKQKKKIPAREPGSG